MPRVTKAILEYKVKQLHEELQQERQLVELYRKEIELLRTTTPTGILSELIKLMRTSTWAYRPERRGGF